MGTPEEADLPFTDEEIAAARAENPPPPSLTPHESPHVIFKRRLLDRELADPKSSINREATILHIRFDMPED